MEPMRWPAAEVRWRRLERLDLEEGAARGRAQRRVHFRVGGPVIRRRIAARSASSSSVAVAQNASASRRALDTLSRRLLAAAEVVEPGGHVVAVHPLGRGRLLAADLTDVLGVGRCTAQFIHPPRRSSLHPPDVIRSPGRVGLRAPQLVHLL